MTCSIEGSVKPALCARRRTWSTSRSYTTSQSSTFSIYTKICQGPPLAEPAEGHTNVYGSFTTTLPAALWLRSHLSLDIPSSGNGRGESPDIKYGYDTPPDSPLSFFQTLPGSRRSPSISRTLTDFDWGGPSTGSTPSSPASESSPPSPLIGNDVSTKMHPVLEAVERDSKLSYRTVCSSCMKVGTNFPRCPRCDDMWCSRACRLQGGKRHVCAGRKM